MDIALRKFKATPSYTASPHLKKRKSTDKIYNTSDREKLQNSSSYMYIYVYMYNAI